MVTADVQRYAANLARDLGAPDGGDPVASILSHADAFIEPIRRQRRTASLATLVALVADKLGMCFEIIASDEELVALQRRYAALGEMGFVDLAIALAEPACFGGTVALQTPRRGIRYVAVIDCRGAKRYRSYFTKCHEISHILVATKQQLLVFRRTHETRNHPEEQIVDRVASRLAFYPPLLRPYLIAPLSFDRVQQVIDDLCPEASWESAVRAVVSAWPRPAAWFRAELGLKRSEQDRANQGLLGFRKPNEAKLRIIDSPALSDGWPVGVRFVRRMRIPPSSVISRVFAGDPISEALEDLGEWDVSGRTLPSVPVRVRARLVSSGIVETMIVGEI